MSFKYHIYYIFLQPWPPPAAPTTPEAAACTQSIRAQGVGSSGRGGRVIEDTFHITVAVSSEALTEERGVASAESAGCIRRVIRWCS
jgi:hypothetical protein